MRVCRGWFVAVAAGAAAVSAVAGCGGPAPSDTASPSPVAAGTAEPRAQLASRVAAAKDRSFIAGYTLTAPGGKPRAVMVTVGADDTWRVDIQGGALGGAADVAIVGRADGTYQCALAGVADAGCVRVAEAGGKLPANLDPRIQYLFTSWLEALTDRQLALSVAPSPALPGTPGTCFSVEPVAVSLLPPIDPGIFCYADDGTFTGAKAAFGTLVITGGSSAGPATVTLPGATVTRAALPLAAPPPPPPTTAVVPGTGVPGGASKTPTKAPTKAPPTGTKKPTPTPTARAHG